MQHTPRRALPQPARALEVISHDQMKLLFAVLGATVLVISFLYLPVTGRGTGSTVSARELAELQLSGVLGDHPFALVAYVIPFQAVGLLTWAVAPQRAYLLTGGAVLATTAVITVAAGVLALSGTSPGPLWWPVLLIQGLIAIGATTLFRARQENYR